MLIYYHVYLTRYQIINNIFSFFLLLTFLSFFLLVDGIFTALVDDKILPGGC